MNEWMLLPVFIVDLIPKAWRVDDCKLHPHPFLFYVWEEAGKERITPRFSLWTARLSAECSMLVSSWCSCLWEGLPWLTDLISMVLGILSSPVPITDLRLTLDLKSVFISVDFPRPLWPKQTHTHTHTLNIIGDIVYRKQITTDSHLTVPHIHRPNSCPHRGMYLPVSDLTVELLRLGPVMASAVTQRASRAEVWRLGWRRRALELLPGSWSSSGAPTAQRRHTSAQTQAAL